MSFNLDETQRLIQNAHNLFKWIMDNIVPILQEFNGEIRYDFGGIYYFAEAGYKTTKYHIGVSYIQKRWYSDGGLPSWGEPSYVGIGKMYGGCADPMDGFLEPEIMDMLFNYRDQIKTNLVALAKRAETK